MNRREWLGLGLGSLVGLWAWPGRLRAADNGRGGSFRFAVLNDPHFQSPKCPGWFERVKVSLLSHDPKPELCLVVGDLAEHGTAGELGGMRDALGTFKIPFRVVPGNHDYATATDRGPWDSLFPDSLNYRFDHRGWQFIGLDSTQGTEWQGTRIQPATLAWLDEQLPKLPKGMPTVLFTHFPLGESVFSRPLNAAEVLDRFREVNLVAAFNGHFHGFTERKSGQTVLTTNRCCSISRQNHDKTPEKGYFLCTAAEGAIKRDFIQVTPA